VNGLAAIRHAIDYRAARFRRLLPQEAEPRRGGGSLVPKADAFRLARLCLVLL
jgi:hypothetical protein